MFLFFMQNPTIKTALTYENIQFTLPSATRKHP